MMTSKEISAALNKIVSELSMQSYLAKSVNTLKDTRRVLPDALGLIIARLLDLQRKARGDSDGKGK